MAGPNLDDHHIAGGVTIIDTWDFETFDDDLKARLRDVAGLISDYLATDRQQFLERETSDHRGIYPINPYARDYVAFQENLIPRMVERTIRAWHYTRLTKSEALVLVNAGLKLSDIAGIVRRLEAQVAAGEFTQEVAGRLLRNSPFQEQENIRSGKFWMTSDPIPIDSSSVNLLLEQWGGEGVYFWQQDPTLVSILRGIGVARVIEIKVPLDATRASFGAARAVISTFARSIGCRPEPHRFDLYIQRPLGREAILAIHSTGDTEFETMARGYPERFYESPED